MEIPSADILELVIQAYNQISGATIGTLCPLKGTKKVVGNKKRLAPSQSDSQEPKLVVPKNLYLFIQEALLLEKQIKEGKREMDFESKRQDVMTRIDELTTIYKTMEWLPSDWKYHPDTASICVPKKSHPVPAEKKPKKIPRNPYMQCVPLDDLGQKAWQKFKRRDAKITALEDLNILTLEQDKTPLTTTSDFVRYIGAFAVDVFNKCYQMYINKGIKKNVSDAKIMDCKYLKFEEDYLFYVTLKAIEQGNRGVYETTIKCEFDDGAISLDTFVLKYRKPSVKGSKFSPESTYETVTG
ncbi:hypothetical protein Tco_0791327 [Tanacetum coccineum]